MNSVQLIGRLTSDPVISFTANEKCVAKYSVAVSKGKDKGANFINCVAFGKTAELMEQYCSKGQQIAVSGSIESGSYEKDGRKIYTTNVITDRIEFLSKGEKKEPADGEESPFKGFTHADDIPF